MASFAADCGDDARGVLSLAERHDRDQPGERTGIPDRPSEAGHVGVDGHRL